MENKDTQIDKTQIEHSEALIHEEKYVKSIKLKEGKLNIVNEDGEEISIDLSDIASLNSLKSVVKVLKDIGKACTDTIDRVDRLEKITKEENPTTQETIELPTDVIRKSGNETITGTKTFRRLKVAEFGSGDYIGATFAFNILNNDNSFVNVYGDKGNISIRVQRDPIEPFEVATKQYVDMVSGTNQEERIEKLEKEIETLKGIILKNKYDN